MDITELLSSRMLPEQMRGILVTVGPLDVVDILLVAFILYKVYELLEDTRAITLVKGLIILLLLTVLSNALGLHVIYWMLQKAMTFLLVALPIVFQPELRRSLEHLGQGRLFSRALLNDEEAGTLIHELINAVFRLSVQKTGALIVLERDMGLNDVCASGIQIDALVTADFLMNVFIPNTPLHDGAVIIRGKRLIAAGCLLPLTDNHALSSELGTRHRAALGLSEQCDALVIVVSEETGIVSVCEGGRIRRHMNDATLREYLMPIFAPEPVTFKDLLTNLRKGVDERRNGGRNA